MALPFGHPASFPRSARPSPAAHAGFRIVTKVGRTMASKFQAPRGTFDILPEQAPARGRLERTAAEVFGRAGYEPIATLVFEDTDLFERGVGQSTDIVRKEMFTFE